MAFSPGMPVSTLGRIVCSAAFDWLAVCCTQVVSSEVNLALSPNSSGPELGKVATAPMAELLRSDVPVPVTCRPIPLTPHAGWQTGCIQ